MVTSTPPRSAQVEAAVRLERAEQDLSEAQAACQQAVAAAQAAAQELALPSGIDPSTVSSIDTEPPPPLAMIAGGVTGVQTGLKAAAAVRVTNSPFGMERTPPIGRFSPPQLRATTGVPVGSTAVAVKPARSCRGSIVAV